MSQLPSLDQISEEWSRDCKIDSSEPGRELLRIPLLHSKYNKYTSMHNLAVERLSIEIAKLKKLRWMYYTGKLDQAQLQNFGWEPFPFTLKSDLNVYMEADDELNRLRAKQILHKECVDYCTYVMKELQSRTWQLRSFIDYVRFSAGDM